jgi:methylmalonyl-CoA/ethylmalonyl-CoA epimerase
MLKIEHIGIAVKSMSESEKLFDLLLGSTAYKTEVVASENVKTSFYKIGESKIELLEGTGPENVVNKFIENRGEGVHHIAFEVEDICAEMQRLKEAGFILLQEAPKKGADNKLICFVHPKTANGVLIELCQEIR